MGQTYKNLEIIIVDDNPFDYKESYQIENYLSNLDDDRIIYIKHSENRGANVARNTGIQKANGDYIAFLDDDDEWLPTKTEKQLKKFDENEVGLVYCPYYVSNNNNKYPNKYLLKSGSLYEELLQYNFIGSTSSIMVKRDCILDVGMFDEKLEASQDYDLYLRISKKYLINYVNELLIIHYAHEGKRITNNLDKKVRARKYLYEKYKNDIKKNPKINSNKNLLLALSYAQLGDSKLKWKYWFNSIKLYPFPTKVWLKTTVRILLTK